MILVLGGARSGKSAFARKLAEGLGKEVIYLATAEVTDSEMAERIRRHRLERPPHWQTVEEPRDLKKISGIVSGSGAVVLLDCLTILLSNIILKEELKELSRTEERLVKDFASLARAAAGSHYPVIFVANEVGLGICPDNFLGRIFRDLAGRINQEMAKAATEVYFIQAGIPQKLKG
jgi:adenosylcobinamide kinase/adenosylcobinamide-phosphate guanylyltransferase